MQQDGSHHTPSQDELPPVQLAGGGALSVAQHSAAAQLLHASVLSSSGRPNTAAQQGDDAVGTWGTVGRLNAARCEAPLSSGRPAAAAWTSTHTDKAAGQHRPASSSSQSVPVPAPPPAPAAAGTAAFKAASRSSAARASCRFSTAAGDAPGPGQFRPLHTAIDKHVRSIGFGCSGGSSSSSKHSAHRHVEPAAATAAHDAAAHSLSKQQQQQQLSGLPETAAHRSSSAGYRASTSAATEAAAGRRASMCTSSAFTPRSAADSAADGSPDSGQRQQHAHGATQQGQLRQQQGTAAFKATTRDQRAAIGAPKPDGGGGRVASGAALVLPERQQQQQQCHGLEFSKQTHRPPCAHTASPLGPGAYFRSGPVPPSLTGRALLAGHRPGTAAPACGRPSNSSRPLTGCCGGGAGAGAAGVGEAGLWAWGGAGDAASCASNQQPCCSSWAAAGDCGGGGSTQQHHQPALAGPQGSSSRRPCSASALAYARGQRGTVLVVSDDAQAETSGWHPAGATGDAPASPPGATQQQLQQQHRQAAAARGHTMRPATAGPCLTGSRGSRPCSSGPPYQQHAHAAAAGSGWGGAIAQPRASTATAAGQRQQHQQAAGRDATSAGGALDVERFSSTGFAPRVKGGKFSALPPAAPAVSSSSRGTELLYEPRPEVQGHMQRAPGWSLPPNRVETSRKWARLAAHAALQ